MKPKDYWDKSGDLHDPFELPRRIARGLQSSRERAGEEAGAAPVVRYIWLHVSEDGLQQVQGRSEERKRLGLDDWLNVIDESASLGAEWLVVYVGASLAEAPFIWRICDWAQRVHGLQVGLHLSNSCLSEDDIERLTLLDATKTFLVADAECAASLRFLEDRGIRVCAADVRPEDRRAPCTNPEAIACVASDGKMFSCGLVLGEERFTLGDALDRDLRDVMADESLPHVVPDVHAYPECGCDACPPLVASRVEQFKAR